MITCFLTLDSTGFELGKGGEEPSLCTALLPAPTFNRCEVSEVYGGQRSQVQAEDLALSFPQGNRQSAPTGGAAGRRSAPAKAPESWPFSREMSCVRTAPWQVSTLSGLTHPHFRLSPFLAAPPTSHGNLNRPTLASWCRDKGRQRERETGYGFIILSAYCWLSQHK